MADKIYRMDKFPDVIPLHFPFVSGHYGLLVIFLISVLAFFSQPKRQRILPKVPVAAADGTIKPAEIRSNFRHGSKAILQQGYQKVSELAD